MHLYPINRTEQAMIEIMFRISTLELGSSVSQPDPICRQRLTYFLIETRRAAYKALGKKKSILSVLDEFEVTRPTYDDWYSKWHRLLPSNVKILLDTK